jgi:cold shock CspA family protein
MARSRDTYNKKENEKIRLKKRMEKEKKKEDRRAGSDKVKGPEDMFAYVDEYGKIVSTPPDPKQKQEIKAEDIRISISRKENTDPESYIRKGKVIFFNDSKGYGFIKDQESQESVFVHINSLENPVKEGDNVTFETQKDQRGLKAVRVKLVG